MNIPQITSTNNKISADWLSGIMLRTRINDAKIYGKAYKK